MDNLTLLEHEVLDVLKKIEYCCESAELRDSKIFNERKFLEIFYTDKNRPAFESELISMDNIEKYLQKNEIDFHLTYNFIDEPERSDGFIRLGKIYGDSIQDIKSKIKTLINKIAPPKTSNQKILKNNLFNFYFNISNGELSLYPKEKNKTCSFAVSKGRYKIITLLIEEKDKDDDSYVSTHKIASISGYKSNQKCREGIHAIREQVGVTFNKIKGDEFIEAKQPDGYRIGKKINISFEDTP